jgi:hypothetical protein
MSSRATSNATRTQVQAADNAARIQDEAQKRAEAVALEQQTFDRNRNRAIEQARAPYLNAGNTVAMSLADLLNIDGLSFPTYSGGEGAPMAERPALGPSPGRVNPDAYFMGARQAPGLPQGPSAGAAAVSGQPMNLQSLMTVPVPDAPQRASGGQMVTMREPRTGRTARIPADQVQRFLAKGAEVVG